MSLGPKWICEEVGIWTQIGYDCPHHSGSVSFCEQGKKGWRAGPPLCASWVGRKGWCIFKAHHHGHSHLADQCHLYSATIGHPSHFLLLFSRASGPLSSSHSPLALPNVRADQASRTTHFIRPQRVGQRWALAERYGFLDSHHSLWGPGALRHVNILNGSKLQTSHSSFMRLGGAGAQGFR